MGSGTFRRAIGAVKDQTSVGLAKVGGGSTFISELDVAIVKATRHDEYPAEEKYIREILSLTAYSRNSINVCVNAISRRLNKTRNWVVALKALILIQRLLGEGDPSYEEEIFFATRRGTRLLNMSDFRDASNVDSWDYSAFVRTYALYLDERLDFRMQSRSAKRKWYASREEDQEEADYSRAIYWKSTPLGEMKTEQIFSRIQHLQQLLERFLACRPTGAARNNRIVLVAIYPVMKESFHLYYDIAEVLGILIDRFMELEIPDSMKVYDIFCRISMQFEELDAFYCWGRNVGVARSWEYPEVDKITQKKLDLMDDFIRDKTTLAEGRKSKGSRPSEETEEETRGTSEAKEEEDTDQMKALPPPVDLFAEKPGEEQKEEEETKKEEAKQTQEVDLLNLAEDASTSKESEDKLALALFDTSGQNMGPSSASAWEAFKDDGDWETALIQTTTQLSGQKAALPGGLDMLLLEGMYRHGETNAAVTAATAYGGSGSASSVAFGSAGRPAPTLALPAPPGSNGNAMNADPFAASVGVAPPSYVQMHDLENKQKLLAQEQMMWETYTKEGRQGHTTFVNFNRTPYNMGGYGPPF